MYYAQYVSTAVGTAGCTKHLMSIPKPEMRFPPNLHYHCDRCDQIHNFRLYRTIVASTPKQVQNLENMCERLHIEAGIEL